MHRRNQHFAFILFVMHTSHSSFFFFCKLCFAEQMSLLLTSHHFYCCTFITDFSLLQVKSCFLYIVLLLCFCFCLLPLFHLVFQPHLFATYYKLQLNSNMCFYVCLNSSTELTAEISNLFLCVSDELHRVLHMVDVE